MATKTDELYREAHRRSHKLVGSYLALWAWTHGVDCVILSRDQLLPFLGLKRMQGRHVEWLTEDLKTLFPYSFWTVESKTNVYATLYVSRHPIPKGPQSGSMTDEERGEAFAAAGLKTGTANIPKEAEIIRIMACLTRGIADFPSESA